MIGNNINWPLINLSSCVPILGLYPAVKSSRGICQKDYYGEMKLFYVESSEAFLQNISMTLALVPLCVGIHCHGVNGCIASGVISTAMVTAAFAAPALGFVFALLELSECWGFRRINRILEKPNEKNCFAMAKKLQWRSNIHFLTCCLHIAGSVGALFLLLGVGACATASTGGAALPIVVLMLSVFAPQLIKYISLLGLNYKYQREKSEEDVSSRHSSNSSLLQSSRSYSDGSRVSGQSLSEPNVA